MSKLQIFALLVLFTSCSKNISIDIANPNSKVVVNSFFSPQGSLLVNISKSTPILGADTLNYIDDAKVELFHNGSLIGELSYNQKGFYNLSTKLKQEGEYSIIVSVPGMETVSSHDSIPLQIPILSLDTISVNKEYLYCEIKFQDIVNTANYYLLEITSKYPVINSDSVLSKQVGIFVDDNIVENGSNGAECKRIFFSDEKIQGAEYQLSFLLKKGTIMQSLHNDSNILYVNFKTISQPYYKYIKTYYEAQTKQLDVYSNIINGYGIFAGYNVSLDSIVFQK